MGDSAKVRPLKIDLSDGPCPYCEEWRRQKHSYGSGARRCDDCGCQIPNYIGMGGSGFDSQTVHHSHLDSLDGKSIWMAVMRELCLHCYLEDYAKAFPDHPDPGLGKMTHDP